MYFARLIIFGIIGIAIVGGGGGFIVAQVLIACSLLREKQSESAVIVSLCLVGAVLGGLLVRNARREIEESCTRKARISMNQQPR